MSDYGSNRDAESTRLHELAVENQRLLKENQELLRKMNRHLMWGFWLRVVWYVILIGLPFALFYYVLEPYFDALGSNFEVFQQGIQELPGFKQFHQGPDPSN